MADYKYTPADFKSDQEVRWCPGCGDHGILNAVQRALPEIADLTDTPHNLFTFVSGIGCSSRFIYYMKTFGFHSVHGRANAVATGVKVANPKLAVWVTTGDGDSLAIGGNHFIHAIRWSSAPRAPSSPARSTWRWSFRRSASSPPRSTAACRWSR